VLRTLGSQASGVSLGSSERPIALPDVVVTNLHRRYTGVSATVRALVPLQRQTMAIGLLDWGDLGLPRQLHGWQWLWRGWSRPARGRYRIWHARRDTEILLGLWLKIVLRQPWKIVFTSAAPKPPGRWLAALLRCCDAVIATSERSAGFLQGPAEIIHHGVDLEDYSPPPGDGMEKLRESVQWPGVVIPPALQHRYWIGAFGRIRPSKGTDLLVDALIAVLPDFPDYAAVLTGLCQTKDLDFLRVMQAKIQAAGLEERIVFLGDLQRDVVRSCYRRAILCVAASRTEGFGLTPLEAMACGRAVLVSGAGVWPQVVDQEVGAVFETGSALSLAAALRPLLLSPVLLWQMGQRGRQRAIRCHSLQQEADRINALYSLLMA